MNQPNNQINTPHGNKPFNPQNINNKNTTGQEMVFDRYVAIALVVGILGGFIIGHGVAASKSEKNAKMKEVATTTETILGLGSGEGSGLATSGDWLEVKAQKAGNHVVVTKLDLDKPYWVAIRDSKNDAKIPYVLGAKRVGAGTYADLSIYVSRATVTGKNYDVVFFKDGQTFDYSSAALITDGTNPVGASFKAE